MTPFFLNLDAMIKVRLRNINFENAAGAHRPAGNSFDAGRPKTL